jgi:hypothetical protein
MMKYLVELPQLDGYGHYQKWIEYAYLRLPSAYPERPAEAQHPRHCRPVSRQEARGYCLG